MISFCLKIWFLRRTWFIFINWENIYILHDFWDQKYQYFNSCVLNKIFMAIALWKEACCHTESMFKSCFYSPHTWVFINWEITKTTRTYFSIFSLEASSIAYSLILYQFTFFSFLLFEQSQDSSHLIQSKAIYSINIGLSSPNN